MDKVKSIETVNLLNMVIMQNHSQVKAPNIMMHARRLLYDTDSESADIHALNEQDNLIFAAFSDKLKNNDPSETNIFWKDLLLAIY
ncbi:MAG: hypothetical protein ACE362_00900 [Phaeodactylibacter xiamenensis]|uniref:Uncharacterized protein n=1 Tax=Phaeodactylibacter xiamenensis TaxID=1524460 RepID=A0A098SAL2_9BACT|nr:hypothetical protein [Phaeodactylibacter xiamenensis]KGE89155.1 hypothetical protein IX84_05165 [Phaeodactylibacter xiamenensis]MCR9050305.1 hypothetical protein [bacterium]